MKTGLMLQLVLPVVLLVGSSEEFFLESPRKALTEFFQSLKKSALPKTGHVQHYHIHYLPMPFPMLAWTKAPDRYYLDGLYDDTLASLGWSDYHYRYTPDPALIIGSSGLQHLSGSGLQHLSGSSFWDDLLGEEILGTDNAYDTIDRNSPGVLVQVPINRPLVFHLPLKKSRQRRTDMTAT
ncbi:uncharacterized protein LOC105838408 [Monomorium pharaonis]|uniref:uncharacterized protein LOC105838408 n=1 Tax=Monomorium pharaonis TaxID=307658 RepID=UPI00063F02EA|nr:uncharacterized protein LOC105838408 [Monomorium pharaonis]